MLLLVVVVVIKYGKYKTIISKADRYDDQTNCLLGCVTYKHNILEFSCEDVHLVYKFELEKHHLTAFCMIVFFKYISRLLLRVRRQNR